MIRIAGDTEDQSTVQGDVLFDTDAPSPGETRIEEVKARPRSAFHFGLKGLLWLMIGCSILVALPQGLGVEYSDSLATWILLIYGCAPLIGWTTAMLLPARYGYRRWLTGLVIWLVIVTPAWIACAIDGMLMKLIFPSLLIWTPELVCIAAVQWALFAKHGTLRLH